jgi:hypothetical protein
LEQQSIEAASTSDAVTFITYVQSLKRKMKAWEKQVNLPNTIFLSVTFVLTVVSILVIDMSQVHSRSYVQVQANCLLENAG